MRLFRFRLLRRRVRLFRLLVPAPAPEPEKKDNPLTREQQIKNVLMALDGYSNAAAFLGDDSPLLAAGTYRRSGLTSNTELLTVTYRENWLAKKNLVCRRRT